MNAEITPAPTEEEAAAIMAAVEHLWPKPVLMYTAEQARRAAAWRFNRASRRHLLTYLRRWLFVFAAGYGLGALLENAFELVYAAACCYSSSCVSASVIFVILLSWLTLGTEGSPAR